jgi:hypothetical protein
MYIEALQKFEADTKGLDLSEAYRKAKPAFSGKLERHFILLKDKPGEEAPMDVDQILTGSNTEPLKH